MEKIKRIFLSLQLCLFCLFNAQAQVGARISGVVFDEGNIPIIGANVVEKNTTNGTITDFDGNYNLTLSTKDAVLVVSYIGYITQDVVVKGSKNIKIVLKEDKQTLDEVVVVGYGVQKKKLVTGATSQVGGNDLMKLSSNGIMGALQSKIPGATITQTSGMPGSSSKVTIRGLGTTGNSEPLYVIDGVAGANMGMLNPSDIESIDVLKDAASAAIYGSRAANGVILVTTKSAKEGKMQVNYDGYYAIQNMAKRVDVCNAKEYMTMQDERYSNVNGLTNGGYDWSKEIPQYLLH